MSGCRICTEDGHFARDCPNKGSGGGGGGACRSCGGDGHFARECPTNPSGGGGGRGPRTCNSCGEEGHISRECPSKQGGGGDSGCRICKETGHMARDCPNKPEGYSGGGGACHRCKVEGHFAKDCPEKPEGGASGGACHRCKAEGHFSKDCPEKKEGEGMVGADGKPIEKYIPDEFADGDKAFEERNATHGGTGINFDAYERIPVKATGENTLEPVTSFQEMELRPLIMENLTKVGYVKPTPVQRYVFPVLAASRDVMACAQTGSGKSCAFLLPILNELMSDSSISPPSTIPAQPEALILAPTRELAVQIGKEGHMYGQNSMVKTRVIYGGTTTFAQRNQINAGCNILVATPGRMCQFLNDGHVVLDKLRYFILDEADRMLEMGFMDDVNKIVAKMPPKGQRVSGMFSATFPESVQETAKEFLQDYIFITIGIVGGACKDVQQVFEQVDRKEKRGRLTEILKEFGKDEKVLIFCASKKGADFLATSLVNQKFSCTSIHGDRLQSQRETALREFTYGLRTILVATAVAARGLDIPKVTVVINYDLPNEIEEYVHRIGRTGRVGNTGKAISFFDPGQDSGIVAALKGILNDAGQNVPDWMSQGTDSGFDSEVDGFGGFDTRVAGNPVAAPVAATTNGDYEEEW